MTVTVAGKKIRIRNPKLWTSEDYVKLTPPDNGNFELQSGKIIFMPASSILHQTISMNLRLLLGGYIKQTKAGILLASPVDVVFSPHDVIQPDLIFIKKEKAHISGARVMGAPDLVIEILSPSNNPKEMSYKKHIYESSGVAEYWIVLPDEQSIVQYLTVEGEFLIKNVIGAAEELQSPTIQGFTLKVAEAFL